MNNSNDIGYLFGLSYDPFGMITVGRSWIAGSGYRYGFAGKESDSEIAGEENTLDFGARVYDTRVGKWFSTDPDENLYPQISGYVYAIGNPILYIDEGGKTIYDSEGNKVTLKYENESLVITGTNDQQLIKLLQNTYADSDEGKLAIEKLNAKDLKIQIVVNTQGLLWPNAVGDYGKVKGLSGPHRKYDRVINVNGTDIENWNDPLTKEDIGTNYVVVDVYGNPDIDVTDAEKDAIVESVNSKAALKSEVGEVTSWEDLTQEETTNYEAASAEDATDKDQRIVNTLIYETNNCTTVKDYNNNDDRRKGEAAGKKSVAKSYKERKKN